MTLVCPGCGERHPADERFCPSCGLPLVHLERVEPTGDERVREDARKIRPAYARGQLVRAVTAHHQAEAEWIQGLLLEEGIPSTLRRTRGFDVPDFLAAGPRDVLVPASGAEAARDVLLQAEVVRAGVHEPAPIARPGRVFAGLVAGVAVVGVIAWAGTELLAV